MNKNSTQGIRYLGSKRRLLNNIFSVLQNEFPNSKIILDVFTGTTRVAQFLRQKGYKLITSDLSWASEIYSRLFFGK